MVEENSVGEKVVAASMLSLDASRPSNARAESSKLPSARTKAMSTISEARSGLKRKLNEAPAAVVELEISPADLAIDIFKENGYDVKGNPSLVRVQFHKPTEAMIEAYNLETLGAARSNDLDKLKRLHANGSSLACCNRFGESLLHLVCRTGSTAIVRFMVEDAGVSLCTRDDYYRTPLHDACWTSKPNFDLFLFIIQKEPELLVAKDVRGHMPLNYVRREQWDTWRKFLKQHAPLFKPKAAIVSPEKPITSLEEESPTKKVKADVK